MRYTSEINDFPYGSTNICYLTLNKQGNLAQVDDFIDRKELYQSVKNQDFVLYAVWWQGSSGCLYQVDDLQAFAAAFQICEPVKHHHDIRWSYAESDDGESDYAIILVQLICGCKLRFNELREFALDVSKQYGWVIDHRAGMRMSSLGETHVYSMQVLRSSLTDTDYTTRI